MGAANPPPGTNPPPPDQGKPSDGEQSRLIVAFTIIVGLLIVLIIAVAQQQLSEAQQLAAIFSGWITSIVAFYFYGQSNAAAQKNIQESAHARAQSEQKLAAAENKITNAINRKRGYDTARVVMKGTVTPSDQVLDDIEKLLAA